MGAAASTANRHTLALEVEQRVRAVQDRLAIENPQRFVVQVAQRNQIFVFTDARRAALDQRDIDFEVGVAQAFQVFGRPGRGLLHQGDVIARQHILVARGKYPVGTTIATGAENQLVGRRRLDVLRRQPERAGHKQQRGQADKKNVTPGKQFEFFGHVHLSGLFWRRSGRPAGSRPYKSGRDPSAIGAASACGLRTEYRRRNR